MSTDTRFLGLWQAYGPITRKQVSKIIFEALSRIDESAVEEITDKVIIELWENTWKIVLADNPGDLISKIAMKQAAAWLKNNEKRGA